MNQKFAYAYDNNGAFTQKIECQKNQLVDNDFLLPSGATIISPPNTGVDKIAVFNGNEWEVVDNFIGLEVYNKLELYSKTIDTVGSIADEFTAIKPTDQFSIWSDEQNNWIIDEDKKEKNNAADLLISKVKDNKGNIKTMELNELASIVEDVVSILGI